MVFDAEVVYHQDEGRGMTETTGGVGLVEVEGLEDGYKTEIENFTCLFQAVHSFIYPKGDVVLACLVLFYEG